MSEATVVNLFTVLRVLLIGGLLFVLPRITRKGLLFGAYIGEELADGDAARELVRSWNRSCLMLLSLALVVGLGISLAGWPVAGNYTAAVVLLLGCLGLYLRTYYAARALAPPGTARQAELATAPLELGSPEGTALARVALVVCLLAGVATVVYTMVNYAALPDRVPTHFGPSGVADSWADKSFALVIMVPGLNLVICPFIALMALLTAGAKRSVRGGSGGRSVEAQQAFRTAVSQLLSGTALLTSALLTFLSVQMIRIGLSRGQSLGPGILLIAGLMLLFLLGSLIRIVAKYGQGGALIEQGSTEAPLTNGLADNAYWVWGIFYVNRDDPSMLVEKRFGIGYTINLGNRKAVWMMVVFLVLILGVTTVGLIGAFS